MKNNRTLLVKLILAVSLAYGSAAAHDGDKNIRLHVNPKWKECSIQLDPSLTQKQWRKFTAEAALVTYFSPVVGAKPMGAGNFEFSILQWQTGIDDADGAWNNTFVHPDSNHWLFEGSRLQFPGLTFRIGVTDKIDVGAYFTKNPGANYGFLGGQVQYNFIHDARWSASARASFMALHGPKDVDFSVVGLDLVAGRTYSARWVSVSPYIGVSALMAGSHENSPRVNLDDERTVGFRGTLGVAAEVSVAHLGMEYTVGKVNSVSFKVGVGF